MAEIKVRNLDDSVASALKARAKAKGVASRSRRRCAGRLPPRLKPIAPSW